MLLFGCGTYTYYFPVSNNGYIVWVFFGVNFLTCLLTLLISEEKIPDPYLFLVPKDVLCHLSCRSLVVCED